MARIRAVVEGRWLDPRHESVYHGKADGSGGPAWVYPRTHTGAGLYVEVHRGAPDGPLMLRTAVAHHQEASVIGERLRDVMLREGLGAIVGDVEELSPRGALVVHDGYARYLRAVAALDRGAPTFLCARIWATPGTHRLHAAYVANETGDPPDPLTARHVRSSKEIYVDVEAYETVQVQYSFLLQRMRRSRPTLHWPCAIHEPRTAYWRSAAPREITAPAD